METFTDVASTQLPTGFGGFVGVFGGRLSASVGLCRSAVEVYEKLVHVLEADDGDTSKLWRARLRLAGQLTNLGVSLSETKRLPEAVDSMIEARALLEALAREKPDSTDCRFRLAASHLMIGSTFFDTGRNAEAKQAIESCLSMCAELIEEYPDTPRNRQLAAGAWFNLSLILGFRENQKPEAIDAITESVILANELAAEHPALVGNQILRVRTLAQLGAIICGPGRYIEADETLEEAVSLAREIVAKHPTYPAALEMAVRALMELGGHRNCAGLFAQAEQPLRAALNGADALLERWPDFNPKGRDGPGIAADLSETLFGRLLTSMAALRWICSNEPSMKASPTSRTCGTPKSSNLCAGGRSFRRSSTVAWLMSEALVQASPG